MRPLFAIAPLALLLAFAGPRPVRWDAGEDARLQDQFMRAPQTDSASAPAATPLHGFGTGAGRPPAGQPTLEHLAAASRSVVRDHMGLGLNTLAIESPSPQGRPR